MQGDQDEVAKQVYVRSLSKACISACWFHDQNGGLALVVYGASSQHGGGVVHIM